MNFMFECPNEWDIVLAWEHKRVYIFELTYNVFLLYKHTDDGVFDGFPKIYDYFPEISEDFPKLFRRPDERSRTFSENFRKFPKMSEDCRRLSRKTRRCFDDTPTNLSTILRDKLDISKIIDIFTCEDIVSSHVRISYRFYQFVTTRYTTDFYVIKVVL